MGTFMPFKPVAQPEDYPERDSPRRPWREWGPEEQEDVLRAALGAKLFIWISTEVKK